MKIKVLKNAEKVGLAAATLAASLLRDSLSLKGAARIVAATGASQFVFLRTLVASPGIDWSKVEMFHLDEYVGLSIQHLASFRKYLLERLVQPAGIKRYHLLDGEGDAVAICKSIGEKLQQAPVDVAFVGIGENGHLAFNDPPADFETEQPYLIVNLDEACRRQQVGEGWFKDMSEVPRQAISMSIRQILKAQKILCIVPELRKARAVRACLEGEVGPMTPASILRTHSDVTLFLDNNSASLLDGKTLAQASPG
jgi:glucosamine-6-phosphate deaminase